MLSFSACKKLIQIDPPTASINQENVFQSDNSAIAAVTSIYALLANSGESPGFTGSRSIGVLSGLSSDELTLYSGVADNKFRAYFGNALVTRPNESHGTEFWTNLYSHIFRCNAAIEGLTASATLTPSVKQQLLGEAKLLRAFFYFYLVNLYGDVPLALTTDPKINSHLARASRQDVYQQLLIDLKEAETLLSPSYLNGNLQIYTERLRPTKWAAAVLLARVYLYNNDPTNAEAEASKVISHSALYSLTSLNNAFLKNSNEAIWQLQPTQTGRNTEDAFTFILPATGPTTGITNPVYLSSTLLNAFETTDARKTTWVSSVTTNGITYYYPYKYKATVIAGSVSEYLMVFRLAEQYLIRAEARARLNNIPGAKEDLDKIRLRAGLAGTVANDQNSLLTAILHERRVELFTELGQRWLDLKRTNQVDPVMNAYAPQKGAAWNTNWQLYPVPFDDIQRNPKLTQNDGY